MKTVEGVSKILGTILIITTIVVASFVGREIFLEQERLDSEFETTALSISVSSIPRKISVPKVEVQKAEKTNIVVKDTTEEEVLTVFSGTVSHYGPDCIGCSGVTASGYNVKNTIYYQDSTYGSLRIVAADKKVPLGSVLRLTYHDQVIHAIVLDRGGAIGFSKNFILDLLCESEKTSYELGIMKGTKVEVLRYGY